MEVNNDNSRLVGEFDPEYCGDHGLYVAGYDPYKKNTKQPSGIGSNSVREEELYLGDNCTTILEIREGKTKILFGKKKALKYWIEIAIKNRELLDTAIPALSNVVGVEHTLIVEDKSTDEVLGLTISLLNSHKERFKERVFLYREQLIEFIKQQS